MTDRQAGVADDCCRYWGHHHIFGLIWKSRHGNIYRCACGATKDGR